MDNNIEFEPIELDLVGLDGNAFNLMGVFSRAAARQGRSKEQIDMILSECMSVDYNHLLATLLKYTQSKI